jgi:hypothetical protein
MQQNYQDNIVFDLEYWETAQAGFEKGLAIGLAGRPAVNEDGRKLIESISAMFARKIKEEKNDGQAMAQNSTSAL